MSVIVLLMCEWLSDGDYQCDCYYDCDYVCDCEWDMMGIVNVSVIVMMIETITDVAGIG